MSSSSDPQTSGEPAGPRQSSTQEIPVVQPTGATAVTKQLPPHPDAARPAPVDASQPTGPVDFVPGLPGAPPVPPPAAPAATPAPPPPVPPTPVHSTPVHSTPVHSAPVQSPPEAAPGPTWPETLESELLDGGKAPRSRAARNRGALAGLGLTVLSVVLLELGLTLGFGGESYWSAVTLWSAFATVCAVLGLLAFAAFYPAGNTSRSGPAWRVGAAGLVGLAAFWLLVVLPTVATDRGFVLTAALAALGAALWIGPRSRA